MVNENQNTKKENVRPSRRECLDCENYKRKIKEADQTLSNRDVLIQMLQKEIQKMEDRHKKFIDDYEKLRYVHCTTLQELTNLKEIQKKLEEDKFPPRAACAEKNLGNEVEIYQNEYTSQDGLSRNNCCVKKSSYSTFKDVAQVGSILQGQNEAFKQLLVKFLEEVKQVTRLGTAFKEGERQDILENAAEKQNNEYIAIIEDMNRQIKDLNALVMKLKNEITVITNNMQQQAEKSSNYVDKLKAENGCIKEQLSEKKSILSSCLCVLEQNHCNISNLSTTIESIICEKNVLAQETKNLKDVIEENRAQCIKKNQEIYELKEKLNSINQERRKEKEILKEDLCKCREFVTVLQQQLVEKEKSVHCERCSLFDQLKLTEESNKVLSDTLVIVTDENKSNLNKIAILSNELKDVNKELEQSESTLKKYVSQLEGEVEEYKCKLKVSHAQTDCEKCGETSEGKDPKELEEKIMLLKTELNEVSLENSEYEEENKYYCQKIDSLMHDLHSLEEENFKIQADNKLYCERVSKLKKENDSIHENKENEIKQLKEQINKLNLENNSLKRKINDVELKTSLEEITRLNIENSLLQEQIKTLQKQSDDYEAEIKALKEELTQLQDELKLRNCNEVEEELMKVQEERRKLTAENELLCDQIQKLQKEHETMLNDKDNEIATLKDENRKREKVAIENQELKETINNLKHKYSLESDESTLGKYKAEIKKLESENNQLHTDIQKLQHSCHTCTSKNEEIQQQNALLRKELGKAFEEKRKMEHACHTLCDEKEKLKRHSDAIESQIESIMQDLRKTKEANERLEKENEVLGLQVGSLQAQPCRSEDPNEELINIREENSKLDAENKILNDYKTGMDKISHKNTMIQGVEKACEEKKQLVSECCSLNQGKRDGSQLSIANDSKNTILQEIKTTNDEKKNVEEENEHLKHQIESLRDNVTQDVDTSKEPLEIRETNSKLKIENRLLENQIQKLQQYCYNYGAKIAAIEYKNSMTQAELKRVSEARKKVVDKYDELSQELEAVKDEKANIENETKETRKKVVIITEELNEALNEIEGLKKQINSQTNNVKEMKDAKTDTNSCCAREHSSSDELNARMELNTNSIGEKQTNVQQDMIEKIENENAGLKNELAKLQQYLKECKEREATQANVEELKELIKSLKQETKIYENENNDLRNQLQNLNQHFSKYDTETEQMKNKIEMINEQLQMARAEKANIEDDYQRLQVQMEKLQQYCTQCSDGNEDIRKEVTILSEELKTAMQEKSVLEKENEVLLRELEDLKQYCIYCSVQKKESETDIVNTELRSNEITIDNLEKENLKKQIEILEQSLSNCKNENTKLKETTERLNQELQTTRQKQLKNANEDKNVCCQLEKPQDTEKYEKQAEEINNKMTETLNTTKQENARLEKENENLRRELQKIQHSIFDNQKTDEESENKINATTKEVKDVQLGKACVAKEAEARQNDLRRHGCDTNADNEEMKHKLKIALEQKDRIERENENLKSAIQNFQQETSKCNNCNEKLKHEINELTEKLKEDHEELQKTHNENELLKEQINGLQREALEAYENEESAILLLQKKITELEQRQSEKLEQLSSCCTDIDSVRKMFNQRPSLDKLPQQAGKPEKCCHEVKDLTSINQGLQKCLDKSNKTLEVCDTEMKEMHNTVKNLNAENEELKQQLQKYVYEAEVNKAEVVNLQEKLNQNRRHCKQAEIERNQLCKNLEESANAKGELASLRQQYNDLLKAKEENDQELRGLREQYDTLRQTLEATNNECDKIKREYKELKASFKSQISNYQEEIQIISNDNDTFCCEPEKISLANRNLQELELKILEKETAIQLLQHENEDLSFEISQLRKNVQKLLSDKQRLTSALNNLLCSLGDKLKNSGDSMTLLNEKNDIPSQCICKNSDGNADTTTPSPKGRCNCMSVIMSTYKMDQVPQNITGCDNSTCIKDVMKFEGKAFRSSSEVLTVPFEFGDEVQRDEKEEKETAGCCGQKDAKHNPVDSKNTPDLSNTEPFIIEPDI